MKNNFEPVTYLILGIIIFLILIPFVVRSCQKKKKESFSSNQKVRCYDSNICNSGYKGIIPDSKMNWWACGEDCEGGKNFTDDNCKCACIPKDNCIQPTTTTTIPKTTAAIPTTEATIPTTSTRTGNICDLNVNSISNQKCDTKSGYFSKFSNPVYDHSGICPNKKKCTRGTKLGWRVIKNNNECECACVHIFNCDNNSPPRRSSRMGFHMGSMGYRPQMMSFYSNMMSWEPNDDYRPQMMSLVEDPEN